MLLFCTFCNNSQFKRYSDIHVVEILDAFISNLNDIPTNVNVN